MTGAPDALARCHDCSWEYHGRGAWREAQLHLEEHPEHNAYATDPPAPTTEKVV